MTHAGLKRRLLNAMPSFIQRRVARIVASPLGARLAHGAFWSFAGAMASRVIALAGTIWMAHILHTKGFGEFSIVLGTITMFGAAGVGLGQAITKQMAEFRQSDPERAGRIVRLAMLFSGLSSLVMAGLLLVASQWLAQAMLGAPQLTPAMRMGAGILLLTAVNGAQSGGLWGLEAFKAVAALNALQSLISVPLMVVGAHFWGIQGGLAGVTVAMAVNWQLFRLTLRNKAKKAGVPLNAPGCLKEWHSILHVGLPMFLCGLLLAPVTWACSAMMVRGCNGLEQQGIYAAAIQWRTAILFLPGAVSSILLPVLSQLHGAKDYRRHWKVFWYNVLLNGGVAATAAGTVILGSFWIMGWYGAGFRGNQAVLTLLAVSAVLSAANDVVGQAILSRGRMWWGLLFNLLWAVALLVSAYQLLSRGWGAIGLAAAMLISYMCHTIWQGVFIGIEFRKAGQREP